MTEASSVLTIIGPAAPVAGDELIFTAALAPPASSVRYTWTLDGKEVPDNASATLLVTVDDATKLTVGCTALANGTTTTEAEPFALDVPASPPPPAAVTIVPPEVPVTGKGLAFAATVDPPTSARYHWDFGDSTYADDPAPVHAYASGGNFTVRLTVGADATAVSDLTVAPAATPIDMQAQVASVCGYVQGRVRALQAADRHAEEEPQATLYRTTLAWLAYEQGNLEAALGAERAVSEPHIPEEEPHAEVESESPAEAGADADEASNPAQTRRRAQR